MSKNSIRLWSVIFAVWLFAAFVFNLGSSVPVDQFNLNFKDSEALIVNNVYCKGEIHDGQLLEEKAPIAGQPIAACEPDKLKPYSSQFGFQGRVYNMFYSALSWTGLSVRHFVKVAEATTAAASIAVIMYFAQWIRRRYGIMTASVVLVLISLSPMIVSFARNLYWALPLMLLPLVVALKHYRYDATRRRSIIFWSVIGILLCLRFLCGYEYVTTLTFMILAAITYELVLKKVTWLQYFQQAFIVGGVSFAAFTGALAIHVLSLQRDAGSIKSAVEIVQKRAFERTSNADAYLSYAYAGLKTNLPEIYQVVNPYFGVDKGIEQPTRIGAEIASMINYAFMPVFRLPIVWREPLGTVMQSFLVITLFAFVIYLWLRQKRPRVLSRDRLAWFAVAGVGLVGYLSWLILARPHSLVHAHINGILMYLPMMLALYVLLGMSVSWIVKRLRNPKHV